MILTYGGVPLWISILPRNGLNALNPIGSVLRVCVFHQIEGIFVILGRIPEFSFAPPTF